MRTFTLDVVIFAAVRQYDLSHDAAESIVETYLSQIEKIDGTDIDRDAITEDDLDFILHSIGAGIDAGDFGRQELTDLEDAAEAYQAAQEHADDLRQIRDTAGLKALAAGVVRKDAVAAWGISRQAVDKIAAKAKDR